MRLFTLSATFVLSAFIAPSARAMGSSSPSQPADQVAAPSSSGAVGDIVRIAQKSSCAHHGWKNRGRAPAAYMSGMALTFAKSLCRLRDGQSPASLKARKASRDTARDALAHYEKRFDSMRLEIDHSGPDTLRSLYTLGIGLGMRESSGKHCEGWDEAAGSRRPSEQVEAGLFQTSYNSMSASGELRRLYDSYKRGRSKCFLNEFSKGVSCRKQSILGSGAGAEFQKFLKACPAFAAEYAMITLRVLRKHYGPINRQEAELQGSCNKMLDQVQDYVEARPSTVCEKLL